MKKFSIYTLGCKVNHYESGAISRALLEKGFVQADNGEIADVYIVNSCTVTAQGDKKARQAIGRFRSANPNAVIVLTGCFPQAFPDKAKALSNADIITGTADKAKLADEITEFISKHERLVNINAISSKFMDIGFSIADQTRPSIKIQDGCDRFCSYCIIPKARGAVRSRPISDIVDEVRFHALNGQKEVVLVGINITCYGRETGLRMADAIEAACAVEGIERVRIGSLEPELITDDDVKRMAAQPKFCPHFHMSVQSGCDRTLARMRRHYTVSEYQALAANLRKYFPDCAITTDIMVGFAGETDEEFEESLAFAEGFGYAKIHVFPYSIREGTRAAEFPNQVPQKIKAERAAKMAETAKKAERIFLEKQVGTRQSVLIEKQTNPLFVNGFTPNYTPVRIFGAELMRHSLANVMITDVQDDFCVGTLI